MILSNNEKRDIVIKKIKQLDLHIDILTDTMKKIEDVVVEGKKTMQDQIDDYNLFKQALLVVLDELQ